MTRNHWLAWGLLVCVTLFYGCGGTDGPARYDVSGSVTFDGKPVPAGVILFTPDGAKNNRGPTGFAKIKDGKYDTRDEGRGTIGGPHIVAVSGFDGHPLPQAELPDGKPLFSDYTLEVDLPQAVVTQDVAVPASANQRAASSRRPASAP